MDLSEKEGEAAQLRIRRNEQIFYRLDGCIRRAIIFKRQDLIGMND